VTTPFIAFQQLRAQLAAAFPERREVIDGSLAALLAGEHIFILGPPGTGKSSLARAISKAFQAPYFERLITKFSTPEELFGPISLQALEQDHYRRVTTGMLPEAHIAFIDEFFRANSAILNALLSIMNERIFHNDGAAGVCPLVTLFGASNELPEGKDLEATFDRFLLRYDVQYLLRPSSLRAIFRDAEPHVAVALTRDDLLRAQEAAAQVALTDVTIDKLIDIRDACRGEGVIASDRRWKKMLKVVQASAWLAGETSTTPEDLLVLTHALWREPKERPKIAQLVGQVADPVSSQANQILDAARDTAARIVAVTSDRKTYMTQAAQALDELKAQQKKLDELTRNAGPRAKANVADVQQEIQMLHAELARGVATTMGFGAAR
jgi:MoxR-like ATPase